MSASKSRAIRFSMICPSGYDLYSHVPSVVSIAISLNFLNVVSLSERVRVAYSLYL